MRGIDFEMDAEETNWKLGVPLKRTEKKLKVTKPPGFQVRKEGKEVKLGRGRGILDENIREARNTFAQAMIKLHNDIVRAERNRKLAETDYLALSDQTLSYDWEKYRQDLRDVPTQSDPDNITWPSKP